MKLENSFEIPVGIEEAWPTLLDIERIAVCLPGATIDSSEGDVYTGRVKIKAGPVTVGYAGDMRMHEVDERNHSVKLSAQGREQRGSGTVKADIAAHVLPVGEKAARVELVTELAITGKPAQLGRGLIADVGSKIIQQFAANLARDMSGPVPTPETPRPIQAPPAALSSPERVAPAPAPVDDSLDLLAILRPHLIRACGALLGVVVLIMVLKRLLHR